MLTRNLLGTPNTLVSPVGPSPLSSITWLTPQPRYSRSEIVETNQVESTIEDYVSC
jgi:hypothetical protein